MAQTLMGALQQALRAATGTTQSYEGDWHAYLDAQGIQKGQWDGRVLDYYKLMTGNTNGTASSAHQYFLLNGATKTISAYGYNFAASGDYFSTPSSFANQITGDLTLVVEAALDNWSPASVQVLVAKDNVSAGGRSYALNIQVGGFPRLNFSVDGTNIISVTCDTAIPAVNGIREHIAVERTASTGKVRFYTSNDMITWTQLGSEITSTTGNIFAGNAPVQFGNLASLSYALQGKVYDSEIYAGLAITGTATLKVDFDPWEWVSGTTWVASETGETWTINGGALIYKAA